MLSHLSTWRDWVNVTRIAEMVVEELGLPDVALEYTGGDRGWAGDVPKLMLSVEKIHQLGWTPGHNSEDAVRKAIGFAKDDLWG